MLRDDRMAGEIGMKQTEFLPEIVPVLVSFLNDESPPVARQAIACGLDLFRCTFQKIAIQVISSIHILLIVYAYWILFIFIELKGLLVVLSLPIRLV